jgi:parallel beta-helix repeat protein
MMIACLRRRIAPALFFAVCCWPAAAHAKVLLVPNQYPSLSAAIGAAAPGDTVRAAAGTYSENVVLRPGVRLEGGWNASFSERDPVNHAATIDGSARGGYVVFAAENATVDGFTITGGKPPMMMPNLDVGPGVYCASAASFTVSNNVIAGNHAAGIYARDCKITITGNILALNGKAGIFLEDGSAGAIRGNLITRNSWAGINTGGERPSAVEIVGNAIHSNKKAGVNVALAIGRVVNNLIHSNGEAGVRCGQTAMQIVNNTLADNGLAGISVAEAAAGEPAQSGKGNQRTQPEIKNNIIASNGEAGIKSFGSGYSYNLLYANNRADGFHPDYLWYIRLQFGGYEDQASLEKSKNFLDDPLFVNQAQHDYHLRPGSPAIDHGDTDPKFNDKQFGPSLGADVNDMGAYGGPSAIAENRPPNQPPQAQIEPLKEPVYAGDKVTLNGAVSRDPNGDELSWQWNLAGRPAGSMAALLPQKDGTALLTADKGGQYAVQLAVTDRWGLRSAPVTLTVSADPDKPPTAKISKANDPVSVGQTVNLSAHDKNKQNGTDLSYLWTIIRKPAASQTMLSAPNAERAAFVADAPGCYTVRLNVSNGKKSSEPDTAFFCTKQSQTPGKRSVPDEYPTIQTAIDTADDGEDIVIQGGTYRENLVVDKAVNLIGVGNPVIDGGSKKGDEATVLIVYLDSKATGRVQGLTVTGGGAGQFGHGLQILNCSPEIVGNRIIGNKHVGVGIHGQKSFTEHATIHDNDIYDNAVGVSNGLGAGGQIYNNTIHNNKVTGIGVRGLATPMLRNNSIYGNYIGIGIREEAYPTIENNEVRDNTVGIAVNPGDAAAALAAPGSRLIVRGNTVSGNRRSGIFISSINRSELSVQGNMITGNSSEQKKAARSGGIVTGYPHEALAKIFMDGNTVSGNGGRDLQLFTELGESAGMVGGSAGRRPFQMK